MSPGAHGPVLQTLPGLTEVESSLLGELALCPPQNLHRVLPMSTCPSCVPLTGKPPTLAAPSVSDSFRKGSCAHALLRVLWGSLSSCLGPCGRTRVGTPRVPVSQDFSPCFSAGGAQAGDAWVDALPTQTQGAAVGTASWWPFVSMIFVANRSLRTSLGPGPVGTRQGEALPSGAVQDAVLSTGAG